MTPIDTYLDKTATPSQRAILERIREIVKELAPNAEEMISYGVPAFKYLKQPVIYFAAFKEHMSLFPASDGMIEAIGEELAQFRTSKGTLQFTEAHPIPEPIIRKIIAYRLADITKN